MAGARKTKPVSIRRILRELTVYGFGSPGEIAEGYTVRELVQIYEDVTRFDLRRRGLLKEEDEEIDQDEARERHEELEDLYGDLLKDG